jgi:hypothetical protein
MPATKQPVPTRRSAEGQATPQRPGPDGQESLGGPTGQTPTGKKVEGVYTPERTGPEGQETAARTGKTSSYRPNR